MSININNRFTKSVITLATGTSIAQAIPIAITPILTRIYEPSDFGVLALFLAITSIIGSIAGGRYELAIILPENDDDALNIAYLSLLITVTISFVTLLLIFLFNNEITSLLGNESISRWLYLVPISVFFIGCFNILTYLHTRLSLYRGISLANVNKSLVLSFTQICLGLLKKGSTGLILGQFLGYAISNYKLLKSAHSEYDFKKKLDVPKLKHLAIKYQDFPKYSTGAILANTMSYQLLNILISKFYSVTTLGYHSLVQKVIGMPSALIGAAISQVYFTEANKERIKHGNCNQIFKKILYRLILVSFIIFIPMYFLIEYIFILVFGEDWKIAGTYARILIPFFAIRFIVAPLTITNSIFEKQIVSLIWQICLLILSVFSIFIANYYHMQFDQFLRIWASIMALHYLLLLSILYKISKG